MPPERITRALARPGRSLQQLGDDIVYALPDDTRAAGAALLLARTGTVSDHLVATWDLADEATTPATAGSSSATGSRAGAWTRTPWTRPS